MTITRKPSPRSAEDFIERAPDGGAKSAGRGEGRVYKPRKLPVSFTAEQDLLAAFDQVAGALGMSRAALLALAMARVVREEGI